ncbi:MAG: Uma2 family endonuclease [Saprospiraceae bacterium]
MEATAQAALTTSDTAVPAKTPPKAVVPGALPTPTTAKKGEQKVDTLKKFRAWTPPEDGFKYEWNNGVIEKSPKMITFQNLHIVQRLNRFFQTTEAYRQGGELFTEPESMTSAAQLRIPDMAYYTAAQIADGAAGKTPAVPEFIIEFVSDHDVQQKVLKKLDEYFSAGARVIWLVLPQLQVVYVYTSPIDVFICKGDRVCSAEPVLPGFSMRAEKLFAVD